MTGMLRFARDRVEDVVLIGCAVVDLVRDLLNETRE